jgi:hypothetical protein
MSTVKADSRLPAAPDGPDSRGPETGQPQGVKRSLAALGLLGVAAVAWMVLFERLPIQGTSLGIDWYSIWSGMNRGQPLYGSWMVTPPWIILAILPLAFISFRASWGIILLLTMAAVVLSVPRTRSRPAFILMALLMGSSFSNLRHAADGNLEGLVILGTLALLWAMERDDPYVMAVGVFLASTKIQVTWLLVIYSLGTTFFRWPRRRWLITCALLVLSIGIGLIWRGGDWLRTLWVVRARSQPVDVSLWATLPRLGLPSPLAFVIGGVILVLSVVAARGSRWASTRPKAGMLISASLLLAPYAAGNSLLSALSIGAASLLLASPLVGVAQFVLDDLKYVSPNAWMVGWGASFATGQLLVLWGCLLWWVRRDPDVKLDRTVDAAGAVASESAQED